MAELNLPKPMNPYIEGCVLHTEIVVDGRRERKALHDAIDYCVGGNILLSQWANDLGLCVQNGKLCVIYGN